MCLVLPRDRPCPGQCPASAVEASLAVLWCWGLLIQQHEDGCRVLVLGLGLGLAAHYDHCT